MAEDDFAFRVFARFVRTELESLQFDNRAVDRLVLHLNTPLSDYPPTVDYLTAHKEQFEQYQANALDENYLISAELERFERFTNPDKLKAEYATDFMVRGFEWALTGRNYTIGEFFSFTGDTKSKFYDNPKIKPGQIPKELAERLKEEWKEIPKRIDKAALGYSYALYVKYLKGVAANKINSTKGSNYQEKEKEKVSLLRKIGFYDLPKIINCDADTLAAIVAAITQKGLTLKRKVLLLYKIGFFNLPKLFNTDRTKQAEIVAALTGNSYKNVYDAIGEGEKDLERGRGNKEAVDKILHGLKPDR